MISSKNSFFKNILNLLSPHRSRLVFICICMVLGAVINIVNPLVNMRIIDRGIIALDFRMLLYMIGLSAALYAVSRILDYIEFKQLMHISKQVELNLSLDAQKHLFRLPAEYFKEANEAQIMNNLNYDISKINRITDRTMFTSVVQAFTIVGGVIGLCVIDARLLILVVLIVPVKILSMRHFSKRREKLFSGLIALINRYGNWFGDTMGNMEIVKLWNLHQKKLSEFASLKQNTIDANIETQYNDKASENVDLAVNFALNLLIYVAGFWEIVNGHLTVGGLFAFTSYSMQIISPISFITKIRYYFSDIKPSMKRYIEFLELPEEEAEGDRLPVAAAPERITFSDISLQIRDKLILSNINLELRKGQKVAIVGENGSGKSSLLNLLLRFYRPTGGRICFDNMDIQDFGLDEYRRMFAVIRQNIDLFSATVKENIDPLGEATDADILRRCDSWGFGGLIKTLPEGLDTMAGKKGAKLSGGEGQKITAIRALLKNAKILIIDEATSNYDPESEREFNDLISSCDQYDYLIAVTHRSGILDSMDRVIRFDGGQIMEVERTKNAV